MSTSTPVRNSQRAPTACTRCAQRRVRCDKNIPCKSCVARGLEASCAREVVRVNGRVTSARPVDPIPTYRELLQQNARLKAELADFRYERKQRQRQQAPSQSPGQNVDPVINKLESQIHLPGAYRQARQRKVWRRSDIITPGKECSYALLEHGFIWTSWIHFAIHIQTYEKEHDFIWCNGNDLLNSEPLWLAIYFSFIAMSLMFMNEQEAAAASLPSENMANLIHNWYDASIYFLHEADFLRIHDIRAVQAIAILLGLAKNVGDFSLQPVLQATGLRIGHALGMDREPPTVSNDPINQEVSRRTWWTIVICEWLQRPESPTVIHEADFDVDLPLNLTDEELLNADLRNHPDSAPRYPRPVQYHHAMISLAQLRYRFKADLDKLGLDCTKELERLVDRTDEALANLIAKFPEHLSSENLNTNAPIDQEPEPCTRWQRLSLSLSFLFYRMATNRELQHRWLLSGDSCPRSRAICLMSAHAIVSLVDRYSDALIRHRPWATASNLFSAAVTLVVEAQFSDESVATAYIKDLKPCLTFFKRIQDQNAVAARAIEVLTKYIEDLGFAHHLL